MSRWRAVVAAWFWLAADGPAMAAPPSAEVMPALAPVGAEPLTPGAPRAVRGLKAGEVLRVPLAVSAGDYLRGTLEVMQGRFQLDLVTTEGRHVRRLVGDGAGESPFQLLAPEAGLALEVRALDADGIARLVLAAQVPASDQRASEEALLSPTMAALSRSLAQGADTASFWAQVERQGTPLVEAGPPGFRIVTFLWRGARAHVRLFGAPSGDHDWLERLPGSDVWFKTYVLPDDTRLAYKLAPDVPAVPGTSRERRVAILATAQADPLNRAPWPADAPDVFNRDSTLTLPAAPPQPGIGSTTPLRGTLETFTFESARLGNRRAVTLYRPPGFNPASAANAMLVLFDRETYLGPVPTPAILEALMAEGRLPPVLAALVSPIDAETRARELPGNGAFADALALELMPEVEARTGARIPAERTILAGSSYGGLAAATIALAHPDRFGNVLALSGSFWWHPEGASADTPEWVADQVARGPVRPVRFHLTAGRFEGGHGGTAGILETSRHLCDVLRAKGYDVSYRTYSGGHDTFVWRGALADGLLALAPRLPSARTGP